jgi:hypothetical protein
LVLLERTGIKLVKEGYHATFVQLCRRWNNSCLLWQLKEYKGAGQGARKNVSRPRHVWATYGINKPLRQVGYVVKCELYQLSLWCRDLSKLYLVARILTFDLFLGAFSAGGYFSVKEWKKSSLLTPRLKLLR